MPGRQSGGLSPVPGSVFRGGSWRRRIRSRPYWAGTMPYPVSRAGSFSPCSGARSVITNCTSGLAGSAVARPVTRSKTVSAITPPRDLGSPALASRSASCLTQPSPQPLHHRQQGPRRDHHIGSGRRDMPVRFSLRGPLHHRVRVQPVGGAFGFGLQLPVPEPVQPLRFPASSVHLTAARCSGARQSVRDQDRRPPLVQSPRFEGFERVWHLVDQGLRPAQR